MGAWESQVLSILWVFQAFLSPVSSVALGGLEAARWMKHNPAGDSAATLIFTCVFSPRASSDVIYHQTLTNPSPSLAPSNFFFFWEHYALCSQQTEAVFPKGPLPADPVRGETRQNTSLSLDVHTHTYTNKQCSWFKSSLRKLRSWRRKLCFLDTF